jgi:threonine/homoserine/homoserine lactone efflux protein
MIFWVLFFKGILIGFAIAAPVGPIGMLCVRRALMNGPVSGLFTGLGAALADGIYGAVAAFGLTAVSGVFHKYSLHFRVVGGFALILMAVYTLMRPPGHDGHEHHESKSKHGPRQLLGDFASTLALTLTNPATIIAFMAIFAALGVGLGGPKDFMGSAVVVAGVFCGSFACWCVLSGGAGLLRHRLGTQGMQLINRLSALVLGCFGLLVLGYIAVTGGGK